LHFWQPRRSAACSGRLAPRGHRRKIFSEIESAAGKWAAVTWRHKRQQKPLHAPAHFTSTSRDRPPHVAARPPAQQAAAAGHFTWRRATSSRGGRPLAAQPTRQPPTCPPPTRRPPTWLAAHSFSSRCVDDATIMLISGLRGQSKRALQDRMVRSIRVSLLIFWPSGRARPAPTNSSPRYVGLNGRSGERESAHQSGKCFFVTTKKKKLFQR
jgi:hypothetical protein